MISIGKETDPNSLLSPFSFMMDGSGNDRASFLVILFVGGWK